jgi:hypothetical protein
MSDHRIALLKRNRDRLKEKIAKWQARVSVLDAKIGKAEGKCPHVPVRIGERLACRVCNAELGTVTIPEGIKNATEGAAGGNAEQNDKDPVPVREHIPDSVGTEPKTG